LTAPQSDYSINSGPKGPGFVCPLRGDLKIFSYGHLLCTAEDVDKGV
jgi:hypothetical protein